MMALYFPSDTLLCGGVGKGAGTNTRSEHLALWSECKTNGHLAAQAHGVAQSALVTAGDLLDRGCKVVLDALLVLLWVGLLASVFYCFGFGRTSGRTGANPVPFGCGVQAGCTAGDLRVVFITPCPFAILAGVRVGILRFLAGATAGG